MPFEIIANPILQSAIVILVGITVSRVLLRQYPAYRLVAQIAFFFALTGVLLYHDILPYAPTPAENSVTMRVLVGIAKAIWWINGAWVLVGFVRVFLIFERKPREGRLLQDLVVGIIYLGAALSVVSYVFGVPIGTLIATSGVFAIILGLALQSTLNDVFSGIALNLGRPYSVGDWVVLDDEMQGRVVETNWRATHLLNGTNDLVIIPNSALAKTKLTNLSSPDESHGVSITVRVEPTTAPRVIADVMRNVLISANSILKTPEPTVTVDSLDGQAVEIGLWCRVKDMSMIATAKSEIFDLAYRHAKSAGLKFAPPAGSTSFAASAAGETPEQHTGTPWRLLNNITLFAPLTEDEKEVLATHMSRRTYHKDAVIAEQDTRLTSLMIMRTGVVSISRKEGGRSIELTRLAPGDYFGEGGVLMGAGEVGTTRALTYVVIYEIGEDCLGPLLRDRPSIAEELGQIMSKRIEAEQHLFGPGDRLGHGTRPGSLASRIRHLFELQHD